ncbi:MAG: DUF1501 domain-containing protein [Gaiellales bacterium]
MRRPEELTRACSDFRRTSRRAFLARGTQTILPIPNGLLDEGAQTFLAARRTRREFLLGGVGALVALGAIDRLSPWELVERASAADGAADPILVSIFLPGGNDALNTLVPVSGPDRAVYDAGRKRLGLRPDQCLPVSGQPHLGWHPAAAGLKGLHDSGRMGVYLAVDHARPDFSHFHETRVWRTGDLDYQRATTGWLGRYLDELGGLDNPLQGVAVEWSTDDILASRRAPSCALFSPGDFDFWSPDVWDGERMLDAYRDLGAGARTSALRRAAEVSRQSVGVRSALTPLREEDANGGAPAPPVPYPDTDTGAALRNLARMLGAGLGIRVATVQSAGMFDTHEGQPDQMRFNLDDLGTALAAFQADLESRGLAERVVTLVWSEFGRRIEDNDSQGTDHGSGGAILLVGKNVNPGVANPEWALGSAAAADGNIPVQLDFRAVYAGLLEQHLGMEAARVLPGWTGAALPVMR